MFEMEFSHYQQLPSHIAEEVIAANTKEEE